MSLPLRDRFKTFRQQFIRRPVVQSFIIFVLSSAIRFVSYTSRQTIIAPDSARPYMTGEKNAIFAFWHGRMMLIPPMKPKGRAMFVLTSHHSDGELIARTLKGLGIGTVRGSSSRGGSGAARGILKVFKSGANISITPDGPRGPNQQAQAGIIHLARLCGCPIIPLSVSGRNHKVMGSWDKMQITFPFTHSSVFVGEPFLVGEELDDDTIESLRLKLEDELNDLTLKADAHASGQG